MIIQYTDVIERNKFSGNLGNVFSDKRFFHDRNFTMPNVQKPYIGGNLDNESQSFILHFKLSSSTVAKTIKIRGLNSTLKDIKPVFQVHSNWEVIIDVHKNLNNDIFLLFYCDKTYKSWKVHFGEERDITDPSTLKHKGWLKCRVAFEYFALLRVSEPLNDESFELPRFVVSPKYSYEHLGSDLRGSIGQPYGRTIRNLKTLELNFARINSSILDEYYNRVGLTIPHFIIPYPENVSDFPPFWGMLTNPPDYTKRNENGWYWNVKLNFKEAY
jgi:hypothetical protein